MIATLNLLATQLYLAQAPTPIPGPSPTPGPSPSPNSTGAEFGKAGPIGLVIVLLLLIGLVLLIRSMNRHMRKLPASFDSVIPKGRTPKGAASDSEGMDAEHPAG